jgi:hypothetical protein
VWWDLAVAYAAAMSLFVTVLAGSEAVAGELKPLTMSHPARSISNTAMAAARRPETGVKDGTMSNIARKAAGVLADLVQPPVFVFVPVAL